MGPYSNDFRLKVVRAYERGEGSQRHLARVFGVSPSFIQDFLQRHRRTGSVQPEPHGGGNPGKIVAYRSTVEQLHRHSPDASLAESCAQLATMVQVQVSRTTMSRTLRQLGLTRKKRHSGPQSKRPVKARMHAPPTRRSSTPLPPMR
jgi:transposase